jgi:hypothetical protein
VTGGQTDVGDRYSELQRKYQKHTMPRGIRCDFGRHAVLPTFHVSVKMFAHRGNSTITPYLHRHYHCSIKRMELATSYVRPFILTEDEAKYTRYFYQYQNNMILHTLHTYYIHTTHGLSPKG